MPKLIEIGKNLYCRIPSEICKKGNLQKGQEFLVEIDKLSGKIQFEKV